MLGASYPHHKAVQWPPLKPVLLLPLLQDCVRAPTKSSTGSTYNSGGWGCPCLLPAMIHPVPATVA